MRGSKLLWKSRCDRRDDRGSQTMERDLTTGLSVWAIAAIVCNSAVGVLILILFGILYKACQVPSRQEKAAAAAAEPKPKKIEQKRLLTSA